VPNDSAEFFTRLGERGFEPMLASTTGTIRVDLRDGDRTEHWLIAIRRGNLTVSRSDAPADCVVSAEHARFDDIASGRSNAMAAALRGVLAFKGDTSLLVRFQRLFPAGEHLPVAASARSVGRQRS
jgi:putative sterol carrier protein